jgi:hypothetical protein
MSALVVVGHGAMVEMIAFSTREDRLLPVFSDAFLNRDKDSSESINLTWVLGFELGILILLFWPVLIRHRCATG